VNDVIAFRNGVDHRNVDMPFTILEPISFAKNAEGDDGQETAEVDLSLPLPVAVESIHLQAAVEACTFLECASLHACVVALLPSYQFAHFVISK